MTGGESNSSDLFRTDTGEVQRDWIDYNGHLNVAYYLVLFDRCVDGAFAQVGLGPDYVTDRDASFFTVEVHINYLRELSLGAPTNCTFQLLDADEKRVRAYLELFHSEEGFLAASCEQLFVHVDSKLRRSAPFPPDILKNIIALRNAHQNLPWPERAGRSIAMSRPKSKS